MAVTLEPDQLARLFPAYICLDLDGRIIRLGPSVARLLPPDAMGQKLGRYFTLEACSRRNHGAEAKGIKEVMLTGLGSVSDIHLRGSILQDSTKIVFLMGHSAFAENGRRVRRLRFEDFAPTDSSMDLMMANKLHRVMMEEAKTLSRDLGEKRIQAEAANVAKTQFLATMSHELRTPLNGIIGMAEMLSTQMSQESEREMMKIILSSGEALLSILNDVLDISKIEADQLALDIEETDFADEVARLCLLHKAAAEAKGVALTLHVDPGFPTALRMDGRRAAQCVTNLLSNALKFTQEGEVALRLGLDAAGLIELSVRDTGIGISADVQDTLFEPFTQADSSISREFGGTGLGLSIVRKLAELMGGSVGVDSVEGEGSVFTLKIGVETVLAEAA
jgi:signal transduction histidine kinase